MDSKWARQDNYEPHPNRGSWHQKADRLKPQSVDPLERVGLPSKGDTSLNNRPAQQEYFTTICERYGKLTKSAPISDPLANTLSKLSIASSASSHSSPSVNSDQSSEAYKNELSTILSAMRKLREAIVATSKHDAFAKDVYIYICRVGIFHREMETYHPALLFLLQVIQPQGILTQAELDEFVGYQILDLCCRQRDFHGAYRIICISGYSNSVVKRVLESLVHKDWIVFWRMWSLASDLERRMLEHAKEHIRQAAADAITRSYFTIDRTFAERSFGAPFSEVAQVRDLKWELDGEKITVRKRPTAR